MTDANLLPCPFCGGKAYCEGHFGYMPQTIGFCETGYFVGCTACGVVLKPHTSKYQAIRTWNTRYGIPK